MSLDEVIKKTKNDNKAKPGVRGGKPMRGGKGGPIAKVGRIRGQNDAFKQRPRNIVVSITSLLLDREDHCRLDRHNVLMFVRLSNCSYLQKSSSLFSFHDWNLTIFVYFSQHRKFSAFREEKRLCSKIREEKRSLSLNSRFKPKKSSSSPKPCLSLLGKPWKCEISMRIRFPMTIWR